MTDINRRPSSADTTTEAAAWLAKLDRGLTANEESALKDWLHTSPVNRTRFLAMARMWDKMNSLSWLADLCEEPIQERRAPWSVVVGSIAVAGLVLAAIVFVPWSSLKQGTENPQVLIADLPPVIYETAVGEQSTVRLADGSEITLNTNSQIHVRLTDHHRLLTLLRGEAHVNVAPDPTRPLSLTVQDKIFQALGTAFSVELHGEDDIELIVTEGTVLVGVRPRVAPSRTSVATPVLPISSTTVEAGEELRFTAQGSTKTAVPPEVIAVRMSWRQGNLVFLDEPLEDALREVSRYTEFRFVFLDESIKTKVIAGRFKAGDIESLLVGLRENVGVAYERTPDNRILLSKQP
ncbi:MAG: FecR domain-containing protein [Pseudomonadota bacterium]